MRNELDNVMTFNSIARQDVVRGARIEVSKLDFDLQKSLILEELKELEEAFTNKDLTEVLDALIDIQYVFFGMVCRFGLQEEFLTGFDLVHRNNMTKLIDDEGKVIVRFREDGKVIKPEGYKKVDLSIFNLSK